VVIAVNALRFPEVDWDRSDARPGSDALTDQMWSIPSTGSHWTAWSSAREAGRLGIAAPERRAYFAQVTFENLRIPPSGSISTR